MYLLWLKSHISVLIEAVGGLGEYFVVEDRQECRLVPVDKRCFDLAMLKMFCDPNSCPNIWGNWVEFKVDCSKILRTHSHRFKTFEDLARRL